MKPQQPPYELGVSEADVPVIEVQHIGQFSCPMCHRPMKGHMDWDPAVNNYLVKCINTSCELGFQEFEPPKVTLLVRVRPPKPKKGPPLVLSSPEGPRDDAADIAYCQAREADPLLDWPVRDPDGLF